MTKVKKIIQVLLSRVVIIALAILIQFIWWVILFRYLTSVSPLFSAFIKYMAVILVLWIVNKKMNPSYKLAWTILILSTPVLGVLVYFLLGQSGVAKKMLLRFEKISKNEGYLLKEDGDIRRKLESQNGLISKQSQYITNCAGYPLQNNTKCEYYECGEAMFYPLLNALQSAKHFIFLEYFIIGEGVMWNSIREILEKKAKEGVDVRLIYDDWGCITTMPWHFYKELQESGVRCAVFNSFRPVVNIILNNRDHRKICVVDGYIGFTGGINLADEYINRKERFGYWKDTAIRLEGEAVWNLTFMFLQMWTVITQTRTNFQNYTPHTWHKASFEGAGFVQPYCDSPLDSEIVGESVYMNMINGAKKYVYISTPYLIIDNEMMSALCMAAKSGIDVKIVTPGIPDKKTVFLLTQSYYEQLIEAGVEIYQYTPGFIHAKSFVCDDELAVNGTINMDYRSLYLHFEDGVWIYDNPVVYDMKRDYLEMLKQCEKVTLEFCRGRNIVLRGFQSILRLLAPML